MKSFLTLALLIHLISTSLLVRGNEADMPIVDVTKVVSDTESVKSISEALILKPGDVLKLVLAGEKEFDKPFIIDREGAIDLPEVGKVYVEGLSEAEAEVVVKDLLSEGFLSLDKFDLAVIESKLPITVLGYVNKPGQVELPSHGNIQMALDLADGAAAGAQLDKMQVRRGEEVINFNYKAYLDSGDTDLLPSLEPLDTIFVPASPLIGNVQMEFDANILSARGDASESDEAVKVFGEVISPGIFSFKENQSVIDLLMRAGGVTRYAGVESIRVINNNEPVLFNLKAYLDTGDTSLMPTLKIGATIFVPKQEEGVKNSLRTVYVMGEVFEPGAYESQEGATFFDILANAGGPTRFSESRKVRIIRKNGTVDEFDLQGFTEGVSSAPPPEISPGDAIFIPEKTDLNEKSWLKITPNRAVKVMGAVVRPDRYEWSDEMSLLDLLAHAGGPGDNADMSKIKVLPYGGKQKPIFFDLEKFMNEGGDFDALPIIKAGTTVMVPELPADLIDNKSRWVRQPADRSIYVFGEVGSPGRYGFKQTMSFLDILSAADGPNADADIHNIKVTKRNNNQAKVIDVDLGLYFETGDETLLPDVDIGDSIYIPQRNKPWLDETKESTVRIIGAIDKPGRYRFNESMTILDLLAEAGGTSSDAYLKKIVVVNMSKVDEGQDQSRVFDLNKFVKNPDFTKLPVVRAGDTIFVPNLKHSKWRVFMDGVRDIFTIASVLALVGV